MINKFEALGQGMLNPTLCNGGGVYLSPYGLALDKGKCVKLTASPYSLVMTDHYRVGLPYTPPIPMIYF